MAALQYGDGSHTCSCGATDCIVRHPTQTMTSKDLDQEMRIVVYTEKPEPPRNPEPRNRQERRANKSTRVSRPTWKKER